MPHLIKASFYKRVIWPAIKWIIMVAVIAFIYFKLQDYKNLAGTTVQQIQAVLKANVGALIVVLLLMPVNWSLEAFKWKVLVKPIANISFINAIKGVLTGLSLSFITPHGLGDYFGRIMQASTPKRGRYVGAVMLGRFCQMIPTTFFGLFGLYYTFSKSTFVYVLLVIILGSVFFVWMFSNGKKILLNKLSIPDNLRRKLDYYFGIIGFYSLTSVLKVVGLSCLRYIIFAFQFGLIIFLFLPQLSYDVNIAGVTWIFLSKSVLPTFNFLSDLGIREFSAIYFFDRFNVDLAAAIGASLTLWMINILVPTIVGAPLTLKMKLKAR